VYGLRNNALVIRKIPGELARDQRPVPKKMIVITCDGYFAVGAAFAASLTISP
jgi:hypothetical protein